MIEQASLVLGNGNWAVKSDSLLGYKTIDGKYYPREFTFTRATTGTRVNEAGLVELVPYNLFTYSEQFDNAAWTKAGTNPPVVTANQGIAPDGTLTADRLLMPSTATTSIAFQNISHTSGTVYTISAYVKTNTSVNQTFRIYGDASISISTTLTATSEWQRFTFTYTASATGSRSAGFYYIPNTQSDLLVWGAQLVEGTNALPYQKTETRLNIPRLDYSLGGCPNILLEPQRTNLLRYSEDFTNGYWSDYRCDIGINAEISPNGIQNAETFTSSIGETIVPAISTLGFAFSGNTRYSTSLFVKKIGTVDTFKISYVDNATGGYTGGSVIFNVVTQAIAITQAANNLVTASIEDYGNGWYRLIMNFTTVTIPNYNYIEYSITTVSTTNTFAIWGAQLEAGSYATSYIPTTTASVTRNQDVCVKTGISSLLNPSEGAFFIEAKDIADSTNKTIQISDGSDNNSVNVRFISNQIRFEIKNVGSTYISSLINYNLNQNNKILLTWKAGSIFGYVNGTQYILSLSSGSGNGIPTALDRINFSFWWSGQPFFGSLKQATIWKTQLTDAECIQLTTL